MQHEPLNLLEFMKRFQTEEQCREFLFKLRWPEGFICPKCANTAYYDIKSRRLYHCSRCGHQVSVTANTIFHKSHTPLNKWFVAVFMMADDKRGVSAAKLARNINVSQPTAWLMLHKIRKAMADRDAGYILSKIVEIDDAYFGAPDEGGKRGRGTDKTPGVIALEIDEQGRPLYVKLNVVDNLQGDTLLETACKVIKPGSEVRTDGFKAYNKLSEHDYKVCAKKFDPESDSGHLLWLHKTVSNLKAFIAGTFHGLDKKHLQRYFDEFAYRFNRRRFQDQLFPRLLTACSLTSTVTYKELTCSVSS
jgi:transposase-like protein/ribosomal protein L37AE/L43A